MSGDFLKILLEGSSSPDANDDIETDAAVDREIEESCLPMSTLIESVFATAQAEITTALETYEMACIIGGAQVVSEGMDQEGASAILTEASNGLFGKIKETLTKIKNWFVSIIKKITGGFKNIGKDTATKFKSVEGDFDKNFQSGKFKYKGSIIDIKALDDLIGTTNDSTKELLKEMEEELKTLDINDIEQELANDPDMAETFKDPAGAFFKALGVQDSRFAGKKNQAEVIDKCKEIIGYKADGGSEIKVTSAEVTKMKEVISYSAKDNCDKENQMVKDVTTATNDMVTAISKIDDGKHPNVAKWIAALPTMMNAATNTIAAIVNMKIQVATAAAKSYLAWMKQVANGKGVTEGTDYVEEGVDTLYLFECADISEMMEALDPTMEMFEWTNLKAVKEFFSGKKKEAHRLTKDANKAFKAGEYKEAKEKYKKALPIWKEILKNIAKVPEKTPGWLSFNDWSLFVPYLNLPLMVCLSYATASPTRYVPKNSDWFDRERISKKVQSMTRTGSLSKKTLLEAIETVVDYIEFQIKACDKPTGIIIESVYNEDVLESFNDTLESIAEYVEEGSAKDDDEPDNDDDDVTENINLYDLAMSMIQ